MQLECLWEFPVLNIKISKAHKNMAKSLWIFLVDARCSVGHLNQI